MGPFAAFKRDEAAAFGASALDASLPFDELALIAENVPYLQQKLQVQVEVCSAESAKPDHKDAAGNSQPGKPGIHFEIESSKTGGGGKAKPAEKAEKATNGKAVPKAAAKAETITDLRKLDEHLSTRSYFDGGHKPSQADVAQLAATPDNVSPEQFPHVARWHRHISSFTPTQKASW